MGKGGEQPVRDQAAGKKGLKPFKLNHMPTEELRKWAKAYGVDSEKNREELLFLMVSSYLSVSYAYTYPDKVVIISISKPRQNGFADGIMDKNRPSNPPIAPPPFTLKDLKDAIPKHCFERHLSTSLGYLTIDLLKAFLLGYAATYISQASAYGLPQWSRFVLWPMYWWAQGCTLMGVWVLSHECGHQSFSESEFANNLVGTISHSALFVPYHPWRITHAKHHNNTGSCDNDEVFSPFTRSDWGQEMLRETPLANFWGIFVMFTVGWIPGYLVMNITGPRKYRGKNANHFSPTAVFFTKEEYWLVVQSVSMVYLALACLGYAIFVFGKICFVLFFVPFDSPFYFLLFGI